MSYNFCKITRLELFNKVWNYPMTKLSKQYGLSDRGLAKLCKRYRIPTPPMGYWVKLKNGHKTNLKPLENFKDATSEVNEDTEIYIYQALKPKDLLLPLDQKVKMAIDYESDNDNKISINNCEDYSHPITKKLKNKLITEDEKGILKTKNNFLKCICVSKETLSRALSILDSLLISLKNRNHLVSFDSQNSTNLIIKIYDQLFEIRIVERIKHIRNYTKLSDFSSKLSYVSSGELRLEIVAEFFSKIITEKIRCPLECQINSVLIEFYKASEYIKNRKIESENLKKETAEN
jgi:hypothetical protein